MTLQATLNALRDAYQAKHFGEDIFDLDVGYLQTSVENNDDRMPLQFFVDYNNIWWFELLHSVDVYHTSLNPETGTGAVAFAITYGDAHAPVDAIHGMQFLRFNEAGKIAYIRTFANPNFWVKNPNPVVQLDAFGNHIWLGTGYYLDSSAASAIAFLDDSADAERFRQHAGLDAQMGRIRRNLDYYAAHKSTQWPRSA
ncbi:MAG: hypothetical protein NXH97_02165 [Rhodobacteraceae bacterium]|nr:hypothetical protein [Paracoccaceae bacterium]